MVVSTSVVSLAEPRSPKSLARSLRVSSPPFTTLFQFMERAILPTPEPLKEEADTAGGGLVGRGGSDAAGVGMGIGVGAAATGAGGGTAGTGAGAGAGGG